MWKESRKITENPLILAKMGMVLCVGLSLMMSTVYAHASEALSEVYHVYVDDEYIGKIDDKAAIKGMMAAKVEEKEKDFSDYDLSIAEDVSFVPERVFNPAYNNSKVKKYVRDSLSVKADAIKLRIAEETAGIFKDKKAAEKVLKKYKAKHVDEAVLSKLEPAEQTSTNDNYTGEALQNPEQGDSELTPGDAIITNVNLSENVSITEQKVDPAEVLTVKQGVKKLKKGTLEDKVHKVGKNEVLGGIANQYDLTVDELLDLNDDLNEGDVLQIDQEIHVTDYEPFADVIVKEEKMKNETIDYETKVIESDDLYKGDEKVKQEGKTGKKEVLYSLEKRNGESTKKEVIDEETTKEPVKKIIVKGTKVVPSRGTGNLNWPAAGGHVTSGMGERWGSMHKGVDIAGASDRSILAADNGTVVSAGFDSGGYGNKVVINHNNGMKTIYAHLSSISVSPGETVEKGKKIGVMGTTGRSTGIHLHFEVYQNGSLQNPQEHL
ncbi:peptidoglycan DD-metalloendopeptidase family protein [Lentibacillus amyloliquefaciens]|uniref:Peptidase M23 n=1 Tax=Lentibacillus amyloliquefaciens TaxID=1472767 RepID=A0A0U4FUT8_9BACI|nr:M23 family metallopeptidase [Lentibacillus amyloliquefaciens]ALX49557.1 peptidase M23 [Lentibacillus amyloliquefaciens]